MYTTKVVLKSISKRTGKGKLNIEVTFQSISKRERVYIDTEESIEKKYWVNGKISRACTNQKEVWRRVEFKLNAIKDTLFALENEHGFVNAGLFKNHLSEDVPQEKDLISLFDEFIEVKRITAKLKMVKKLITIRNQILKFTGKRKYYLHDFNQKLVNQLAYFWQQEIKLQPNTIHKNFKFLLLFMNYLHKEGILDSERFRHLNYPKAVESNVVLLEMAEVKLLMKYQPNSIRLSRVKDLFLILIFTGLRFSDGVRISKRWVSNGFLLIHTQKTDEKISIPLHPVLKELLEKYEYDLNCLRISNQKFNKAVKELCMHAGINQEVEVVKYEGGIRKYHSKPKYELIASHTGRRTFITNSILAGIPLSVIQKITGHKKLTTLQKYVDISDGIKAEEMEKLSKYFA